MAEFELSRSTHVDADPATVHALVDHFPSWQRWSPWEGVDPDLRRTYGGAERGVGATYAWAGNRKAGEGRMEITESTPSRVAADLEFLKPFRATNVMVLTLEPGSSGGTDVTWTLTGQRNAVMSLMGRLFFDKTVAQDFDRGLANLKRSAEQA